jgi:16S rRNA (cytidine1402-2'-O)-methyltransferase
MPGILSFVSTPIGNLQDITLRAIDVFRKADAVACEDTRVTRKLLSAHGIEAKRLVSIHQHTAENALRKLIQDIDEGQRIAYASDAGTPGVNDPGGRLAELAYEQGVRIEIIPGASALTAAIAACGFPMEHFTYVGFIPMKKHRARVLKDIGGRGEATIFFESTHRIEKTMAELSAYLDPERLVYVGRELTKLYETHLRGSISSVRRQLENASTKGEFTVIVAPHRGAHLGAEEVEETQDS